MSARGERSPAVFGLALAIVAICGVAVAAWLAVPAPVGPPAVVVDAETLLETPGIGTVSRIQIRQAEAQDFEERGLGTEPGQYLFDPTQLRLIGSLPDPEPSTLCDEAKWPNVQGLVAERDGDRVFVDEAAWTARTVGGQGGLASYLSKCLHDGREVEIHAAASGVRLAIYSSLSGYRITN